MTQARQRKILVIGGSRGIGAAIVRSFAGGGDRVVFTYGGSAQAAESLAAETGATARQADAADHAQLLDVLEAIGPVDVLVYNAAILIYAPSSEIPAGDVDRMIDVNIRGAYHSAVEAARTMPDDGRIILIGSTNGDRVPLPGIAGYAMTKSALQGLARGLSRELGARGITVNVVQPGPTDTDMNPADAAHAPEMHAQMSIKRHGRPDEIADLVHYLASAKAQWITGTTHTIDGGFAA